MATGAARAARNHEARARLDAALAAVGKRLGIVVPPEPKRMKDPGLQPIVEIERFSDFAEAVLWAIEHLAESGEAPAGYEALTVAMLREELAERGIEVPAKTKKTDLIAVLEEADAQAQADEETAEAAESSDEPARDGESDDAGDGLEQPEEDAPVDDEGEPDADGVPLAGEPV